MKRLLLPLLLLALLAGAFLPVYAARYRRGRVPRTGEKRPMLLMKTNYGDLKIELFEKEAPETVKNFLKYVESGFYKETLFHRVIDGFMIQGGGFDRKFIQKPTDKPIRNEATNQLGNRRGTLAMARTQVVDSATSQFFINLVDNDFLNFRAPTMQGFGYCVFGRVTEGLDVIDKIAKVKTGRRGMHADVPVEDVVILDVVKIEQ